MSTPSVVVRKLGSAVLHATLDRFVMVMRTDGSIAYCTAEADSEEHKQLLAALQKAREEGSAS